MQQFSIKKKKKHAFKECTLQLQRDALNNKKHTNSQQGKPARRAGSNNKLQPKSGHLIEELSRTEHQFSKEGKSSLWKVKMC